MCVAIMGIREEGVQEGVQEGLQRGIQKGIQKGIQQGIQKGILQTLVPPVCHVLRLGQGIEDISKCLCIAEDKVQPIYDVAVRYAPDYVAEQVLEELISTVVEV